MKEFIGHKIQKERIYAQLRMEQRRESEVVGQKRGIEDIYAQYWDEKLGVIVG